MGCCRVFSARSQFTYNHVYFNHVFSCSKWLKSKSSPYLTPDRPVTSSWPFMFMKVGVYIHTIFISYPNRVFVTKTRSNEDGSWACQSRFPEKLPPPNWGVLLDRFVKTLHVAAPLIHIELPLNEDLIFNLQSWTKVLGTTQNFPMFLLFSSGKADLTQNMVLNRTPLPPPFNVDFGGILN
jgi:hypothetical protein